MRARLGVVVVLSVLGVSKPAVAAPTASVVSAKSDAGTAPGAQLLVTPKVRVAGPKTRVALTAQLKGPGAYKLKAAKKIAVVGTKTVPFTVKLPKAARVGTYTLTVCVAPAKKRRGCLKLKKTVLVTSFTRKGRSLTAARTLDADRAVSATIGPDGGTLATTAADGATATLTIPKNALLLPVEIVMTPVTAINGHPVNPNVAAGVDLQPHGLDFAVPARLALVPTVVTKPIDRTVLTGDEDGTNTRPELFKDAGDGATLTIFHFSSYELMYVPAGNRAAQRAMVDWKRIPPGPDLQQMTAQLAETLGLQRQSQLLGSQTPEEGAAAQAQIEATVAAYYRGQVVPQLEQAKENCQLAPLAVEAGRGWLRVVQLQGLTKKFAVESDVVEGLIKEVLVAAMKCVHKRCVVDGFPEAFGDYVALLSQAQLMGVEPPYELQEAARRCLRFRIDFDSVNVSVAGENQLGGVTTGPGYVYHVVGEKIYTPVTEPTPTVPLNYFSFTGSETDSYFGQVFACTNPTNTAAAAGGVGGSLTMQPRIPMVLNTSAAFEQYFRVVVEPGDTQDDIGTTQSPYEKLSVTSTGTGEGCAGDPYELLENRWARTFAYVSSLESKVRVKVSTRPYHLAGFTRGVRPVFMTRTTRDAGVLSGNPYDITTTISLVHVPLKDDES